MSSLATPPPSAPANDPFAIGWRDVTHTRPDGTTVVEQVPLTLEDALHPQEGDTIVQNTVHNRDWRYLQNVAESRVADDPHALVLADCKVLWEDGTHHSPDIAVIRGVPAVRGYYSQFDVTEEGARLVLIVEVVAPTTRANDVATKVEHYHRNGVRYSVVVDRESDDAEPKLIGYERVPRRYRRMTDEDGRLWLEPLGIFLGTRDGRVIAYDGATEQELGDYAAVSAALQEEQERADAAEARAATEKTRADGERARAEGEKVRADGEKVRADGEKARADAAEARLRELEVELQRRPPAEP